MTDGGIWSGSFHQRTIWLQPLAAHVPSPWKVSGRRIVNCLFVSAKARNSSRWCHSNQFVTVVTPHGVFDHRSLLHPSLGNPRYQTLTLNPLPASVSEKHRPLKYSSVTGRSTSLMALFPPNARPSPDP